jgi:hypothetical protein
MKAKNKFNFDWAILLFSLAGTLFSGYLTWTKLATGSCPIHESCPYFLGYPACIYGLIMFSILLILSAIVMLAKKKNQGINTAIKYISLAGVLFAGYFSVTELFFTKCAGGPCQYSFILPTCMYGLLFYTAVFILSLIKIWKR